LFGKGDLEALPKDHGKRAFASVRRFDRAVQLPTGARRILDMGQ